MTKNEHEIAATLYQFHSTIDHMKHMRGLLDEIFRLPMEKQLPALRELFFNHYDYGRGMLEKMDDFIREGEMFLTTDAVSGLLDELKDEWGPELMVDNAIMSPISIYKEGKHGIRIENLVAVTEAQTTDFGQFYTFEVLTCCPYERDLIVKSMLTADERRMIDEYHQWVRDMLIDMVDEEAKSYLIEATKPL